MKNSGKILILLGASGSGKTRVYNELRKNSKFYIPVYSTTRECRNGEVPEKDYHFITEEQFIKEKKDGNYEVVFNCHNYNYGIPFIKEYYDIGKIVVLGVSRKNVQELKEKYDTIVVYMDVEYDKLKNRLESREREDKNEIERRLSKAQELIEWSVNNPIIDYIITNQGQFEQFMDKLLEIV